MSRASGDRDSESLVSFVRRRVWLLISGVLLLAGGFVTSRNADLRDAFGTGWDLVTVRHKDVSFVILFVTGVLLLIVVVFLAKRSRFLSDRVKDLETPGRLDADRTLLRDLLGSLPSDRGAIGHLRDDAAMMSVPAGVIYALGEFVWGWNNPEHEFHDRKIENARIDFLVGIETFLSETSKHLGPTPDGTRFVVARVHEDPALAGEYDRVIRSLAQHAAGVVSLYDELVRTARKQLST
jgi:hypothetical protein